VSSVDVAIGAEEFSPGAQLDAALAPQDFVDTFVVDVENRHGGMRAARARIVLADANVPTLGHVGLPALQEHRAVGALTGHEDRIALRVTPEDEVSM